MSELEVLVEQLDELLEGGAMDADDAMEIAVVAGLAARLGASREVMAAAEAWRDGEGKELLEEAFDELELDEVLEAIDGVIDGQASEEEIEEAIYDFDDLVAAALWCKRPDVVRHHAHLVARTVRQVPDPFAAIADVGREMARLPSVGSYYEIYDYWMAVADAETVS